MTSNRGGCATVGTPALRAHPRSSREHGRSSRGGTGAYRHLRVPRTLALRRQLRQLVLVFLCVCCPGESYNLDYQVSRVLGGKHTVSTLVAHPTSESCGRVAERGRSWYGLRRFAVPPSFLVSHRILVYCSVSAHTVGISLCTLYIRPILEILPLSYRFRAKISTAYRRSSL